MAVGAYVHYYTISETERVTGESSELLNVGLARSALNRDLSNVISDLIFLSNYIERQGFASDGILNSTRVGQLYYTFIKEKRLCDQVRFIGLNGQERVRVNFSAGQPELVSAAQLQDKSKRYYFMETMQLTPGEIYLSPLDLNIEEGEIEQPFKPVMRFAVPMICSQPRSVGSVRPDSRKSPLQPEPSACRPWRRPTSDMCSISWIGIGACEILEISRPRQRRMMLQYSLSPPAGLAMEKEREE